MTTVDALYNERRDFCVLALTGYTAAGCSQLAGYMSDPGFYRDESVRNPLTIGVKFPADKNNGAIYFNNSGMEVNTAISLLNFKRKYEICHDFICHNYQPYSLIKYSWVLLIIALRQLAAQSKDHEEFRAKVLEMIADKFRPSVLPGRDGHYMQEVKDVIGSLPWTEPIPEETWHNWQPLHQELQNLDRLYGEEKQKGDIRLAAIMGLIPGAEKNPSEFMNFRIALNEWMFRQDYYCASFFYHRLGYQLRKCGDAEAQYNDIYEKPDDFNHIYDVVKVINDIIKGIRHALEPDKKSPCRVVIDSIRNSLEARYLKERYAAFYLIAVHDDEKSRRSRLKKRIEDLLKYDHAQASRMARRIDMMTAKTWALGHHEELNEDFEKGKFAAHNTAQCVADAEIHISNSTSRNADFPAFQSMAEQWLKYAALILHPGLITPSSEERCMVVAYTAKFNSGCLSRQVGAVITNYAHTIRSIGWNDVPYGQTPCSLRTLLDFPAIADKTFKERPELAYLYSDFERGSHIPPKYNDETFTFKIQRKYGSLRYPDEIRRRLKGLPFSYCFKSHHNKFEGDKNQVHTRALHAEENAILQMARFGGTGLENGIIYVTASPCELCCKKLYQIGIRKIVYIDEYPGISRENIISVGFKRPDLKQFQGAFGATYFKLYQSIMPYKEELTLRMMPDVPTEKKASDPTEKAIHDLLHSLSLPTDPANLDDDARKKLFTALSPYLQ